MKRGIRWLALVCAMVWCMCPLAVMGEGAGAALPDVGGQSAILIDLQSGEVLFEKEADKRLPIASVTKVMTMLLTMEAIDHGMLGLQDRLTCSSEAASYGGSQIWLETGEQMTVDDLLKAVAVVSANDACAVLAEAQAGSVAAFVGQMNQRAAELGMENTNFLDCCGLNDEAYSSARDVAIMSRELMKHERVVSYTTIWMDSLRGGTSELTNTNKLIRYYEGATGLKTGTTSTAGHCLSATAERGGLGLCAVILGCETTDERFGGARKMLDWGFANFTRYTPATEEIVLTKVAVLHGEQAAVMPVSDEATPLLLRRGEEGRIRTEVTLANDVEAPVLKGQVLGTVTLKRDEEVLASYPIRALDEVKRLGFWKAFGWLWREIGGLSR